MGVPGARVPPAFTNRPEAILPAPLNTPPVLLLIIPLPVFFNRVVLLVSAPNVMVPALLSVPEYVYIIVPVARTTVPAGNFSGANVNGACIGKRGASYIIKPDIL